MENYKVGIKFGTYSSRYYCMCGKTYFQARDGATVCECGNDRFIDGGNYRRDRRAHDGIYTSLRKDAKGFKATKQELIINYKCTDDSITYKLSHTWELDLDIPSRSLSIKKNGKDVIAYTNSWHNVQQFFKSADGELKVARSLCEDNIADLISLAYHELGATHAEYVPKLGRGLLRLLNDRQLPRLELFSNAGYGTHLKEIYRSDKWMNSTETKPHKILGVPKFVMNYLKGGEMRLSDIKQFRPLIDTVGGNNFKELLQIFKEESQMSELLYSAEYISILYHEYGYKDLRRLTLYLTREVKLEQGITSPATAIGYLRDLNRMCKDMNIPPKEKYPKSLKKNHDIVQMNFKVQADAIKNRKVKEVTDSEAYTNLTINKKDFSIIAPQSATEVIQEGSSLSHCVASYVTDIINGKCKILFLRKTEQVNESLVTIEVRDRNIRQVRGFSNRRPTPEEMTFVEQWAEDKKLVLQTH